MKIYNLPEDEDFSKDIMNDLKGAKTVVLISPFLSINVIKEWREIFKNGSRENFTVYDNDQSSQRRSKFNLSLDLIHLFGEFFLNRNSPLASIQTQKLYFL